MSMTDPIADMLTRIRNAQAAAKTQVSMPSSKVKMAIAQVLRDEGYISDFAVAQTAPSKAELTIALKYFEGQPAIREIKRVSKPGRRVYCPVDSLPRVANGLGITIISTPSGVMADHDARDKNVGGELLCTVF